MSIESNTFAEACYDQSSVAELEAALQGPADETDMAEWGLNENEWRTQIEAALADKRADERV